MSVAFKRQAHFSYLNGSIGLKKKLNNSLFIFPEFDSRLLLVTTKLNKRTHFYHGNCSPFPNNGVFYFQRTFLCMIMTSSHFSTFIFLIKLFIFIYKPKFKKKLKRSFDITISILFFYCQVVIYVHQEYVQKHGVYQKHIWQSLSN